MGWVPETRLLTFGSQSSAGDVTGGSFLLAPVDTGDLTRTSGGPLSVRLRHRSAWYSYYGDRYHYLTFRERASPAGSGLLINDVPHGTTTVGNSVLLDTTPATDSVYDAHLDPSQAYVHAAPDASYLIENAGVVKTATGSSDTRDNALALRMNRISTVTNTTAEGLGCYGVSCQPGLSTATDVSLPCLTNSAASATVTIAVTDLGFPSLVRVWVPNLASRASTSPQQAVTATLCVPTAQASTTSISLAAYDSAPMAEVLTTSPLSRGHAPYPGRGTLSSATQSIDSSCLTAAFYVQADAATYAAATAKYLSGFYSSSASAPAALTLTLRCAAVPSGAAATIYGTPADVGATTTYSLSFSNAAYSGAYSIDASQPYYNGAPQYVLAGSYRLYWSSNYWYIATYASKNLYYRRTYDTAKNLLALTSFDSMTFSATPACPIGSFYYTVAQGCLACPVNSRSRGGAVSSVAGSLSAACVCSAGYYMAALSDGTGRYGCVACGAGTYKERPGNDASSCASCPSGYTSTAGAYRCVPSVAVSGTEYPICKRYTVSNFYSNLNGLYVLDTTTAGATTTRDGVGEARAVYAQVTGGSNFLLGFLGNVETGGYEWIFQPTEYGTSYYTSPGVISSLRPPGYWTTTEFGSAMTTAAAVCTCEPYGSTAGGCTCGSGQTADATTGRCKDVAASGCSAGYTKSGTSCVDTNECASNNGGCSHTCANSVGSYACSCPTGWGLDATSLRTCSPCADDQYVSGSGLCTSCSAGMRRNAAGTACGCPFGYVAVSTGCALPAEITLDTLSTATAASALSVGTPVSYSIATSPLRGRYVACAPSGASGVTSSDSALSVRVWQQVAGGTGSLSAPGTLYLVFEPGTASSLSSLSSAGAVTAAAANSLLKSYSAMGGTWSVYCGGYAPASLSPTPRYAYVLNNELLPSSTWASSVTLPSSGASVAVVNTSMVPAATQQWHVWGPWPSAFAATASLFANVSNYAAQPVASLPTCGTLTTANAGSASGELGASTLNTGPGLVAASALPTATPSASTSVSATRSASAVPLTPSTSPSRSSSASVPPSVTSSGSASPSVTKVRTYCGRAGVRACNRESEFA